MEKLPPSTAQHPQQLWFPSATRFCMRAQPCWWGGGTQLAGDSQRWLQTVQPPPGPWCRPSTGWLTTCLLAMEQNGRSFVVTSLQDPSPSQIPHGRLAWQGSSTNVFPNQHPAGQGKSLRDPGLSVRTVDKCRRRPQGTAEPGQ